MKNDLQHKLETLKGILASHGPLCVAYSGGVDSALLLRVAQEVLGEDCIAITADGAMLPRSEFTEAQALAKSLGAKLITIPVDVCSFEPFVENGPRRCYFCKKEIFTAIKNRALAEGITTIVDGSNLDDGKDYRPGIAALEEMQVLSPFVLADMTKADIRGISAYYGLPTADKPSMACLATRIPTDTPITPEALALVEAGEEQRKALGLGQYRLRLLGDLVKIECPPEDFGKIMGARQALIEGFKALGVRQITLDLEGYGCGKMNRTQGEKEEAQDE